MIVPIIPAFKSSQLGYISGTDDGIVTVGGKPASRKVYVFDVKTLRWLSTAISAKDGHYLIMGLDPNERYLIMARDLPPTDGVERYEPAVWDYVVPKDDKTIDEQMELWQSWQT